MKDSLRPLVSDMAPMIAGAIAWAIWHEHLLAVACSTTSLFLFLYL
jgi:hypothetical protein